MRRLLAGLVALLAACASTSDQSDWERQNEVMLEKEEGAPLPKPPPFPRRENLVEFEAPGAPGGFRFFIDAASLRVGSDKRRTLQYVLVARSSAGNDNVSFEELRCSTAEYRTYAFGQPGGTWGGRPSEWREVASRGRPWHLALLRDYLCPQGVAVRSAEEGLRALREGGHPFAKGFSGDALLGR